MRSLFPLLLLLVAGGLGCNKSDPVLARVGGHTIRASAFLKEVEGVPFTSQEYLRSPAGRKELLELLVRRKIVVQESESQSLDADTRDAMASLTEQYQERRRQLRRKFQEERERLLVAGHTRKMKEGPLKVTDQDIRRFWENESEVRAAHILVSDRALADQLSGRLSAGEKFEALAKTHSEDPGSAPKGGDAGYLIRGSLVPEFETALFEMKRGETSGVVVSPYGFHIIRRGEDRALSKEPLDESMKERIGQALESQKMQAWFEELRRRHPTTVHTEALNDIVFPSPPTDPSPVPPAPSATKKGG